MKLPECDKGCKALFHQTSGRHLVTCKLNKYDRAIDTLECMKLLIMSGEAIPNALVESLGDFVEVTSNES